MKPVTFEKINKLKMKTIAQIRVIWPRLLNINIPIIKGYLVLILVVLAGFSIWIGSKYLEERRLIEAIRHDPRLVQGYDDLEDLYWKDPQWPKRGQSVFQQLANEYPDNPWPLEKLAWLDYGLTNIYPYTLTTRGFEYAEQAKELAIKGKDDEVLLGLSGLYYRIREFEKASQTAAEVLKIAPDSHEALYGAGLALKQSGNLKLAEQSFQTCTKSATSNGYFDLCQAELLTATRELTITLSADHLMIQKWAEIENIPEDVKAALKHREVTFGSRRLAWGNASFGSKNYYYWIGYGEPISIEIKNGKVMISDQLERVYYTYLWRGIYDPEKPLSIVLSNLPLTAYRTPTTITVIAEGAEVISATQSFVTVNDKQLSWQLAATTDPGYPLEIFIEPDQFNRRKLWIGTNNFIRPLAYIMLNASSTIWGLFVLIKIRRDARNIENANQEFADVLYHFFHPHSIFSWLFDLALLASAGLTILYPLWLMIDRGVPVNRFLMGQAYVFVLGFLLVRLALGNWHQGRHDQINFIHLGAIVFTCYLIPRLLDNLFLLPIYLLISGMIYYLFLVHNSAWFSGFDWLYLKKFYALTRRAIVEKINSINHIQNLESEMRSQELALAKGTIKVAEYNESREILAQIIQKEKDALAKFRQEVGLPDDEILKNVLFRVGPAANPFRNSLIALGFGLIPYAIFLVLASYQEEIVLSDIWNFLFTTVGVPWGPIYLFFFGYFYRVLWGDYGVVKGLVFGIVLAALNTLFDWMWLWNQVDGVQLWGTVIRILVTFVFTGVMMDWASLQFSWRQVRISYNSQVFTIIVTVFGTALTSLITSLATGTADRLLSIALQGVSITLGGQSTSGP
ncbi:MAG: hypothetical protein DPW09_36955 [Anaerolineae bacterium]|nr:hypothetical protein [Anaerolineales bacterium]MCQ3979045.1 hypothetical protein [Anaerolineae bacterium]